MDFTDIDIDKISITKSIKTSFDIKLNNNNVSFWTPKIMMPFGYQEKFHNYYINFELYDVNKNKEISAFLDFLIKIEQKLTETLGIDNFMLNSQIRMSDAHNPVLYTKVNYKNNKILTSIIDDNSVPINFFKMDKECFTKVKLTLDKIWNKNGKYYFKYLIREMICYKTII